MTDTACGQARQQPANPAAQACYDKAWEWLVDACAGCGGNQQCQNEIVALYWLRLFECDHPMAAASIEFIRELII